MHRLSSLIPSLIPKQLVLLPGRSYHLGSIALQEAQQQQQEQETSTTNNNNGNSVGEKHVFQAETKRLLDIVAKSLYQDKEVFIRELISNSSDALEKAKYYENKGELLDNEKEKMEIRIRVDKDKKRLVVEDTGVGMTRKEIIHNLGTIAHSGTSAFLANNNENNNKEKFIGQFGVGFYSIFTVADKVDVYSRSGVAVKPQQQQQQQEEKDDGDDYGHVWSSDGQGTFEISKSKEKLPRGTKIVATLKSGNENFFDLSVLENIVKKYSNFVGFPVLIQKGPGQEEFKQINTVKALWMMEKNEITEQQHNEFYQFISKEFTPPMFKVHFITDAPINIRAIFYTPAYSLQERLGMGRYEPGVSLYSRKVLIAPKSKEILPEWLRFVKGVVDSEDLPLNVSREFLQDSSLIRKMNKVLTSRIIKSFVDESKNDKEQYLNFWREFGSFISEGTIVDEEHRKDLAKLLRFNNAAAENPLDVISLEEYEKKMDAKYEGKMYYLLCRSRESGLQSPYYEIFKRKGIDVLLLSAAYDTYTMESLKKYNDKELVNIESDLHLEKIKDGEETHKAVDEAFLPWFKKAVGEEKISKISFSSRLVSSPAIVVNHSSGFLRQATLMMTGQQAPPLGPQQVEINPTHPLIQKLESFRSKSGANNFPELAAKQVYDNALMAAGLMDDPKDMLVRLNDIVEKALDAPAPAPPPAPAATSEPVAPSTPAATEEPKKQD